VPHGHDQTQEILQLLSFFFQKFELQQLQLGQNIKIGCKSHFARIAAAATRKKNREIDGLAAAATRQKSGKLDQKIRVVATATRKKKLIKEKELNKQ